MHDQAEKLRRQMLNEQVPLARSIAIVSGKGGVGKSNFSTNFAYALRSFGKKVLIIDMDIGMGNIHILLGMGPSSSLRDYLSESHELSDVINKAPEGLDFISGGSGLNSVMEWSEAMFKRLITAFEYLQTEYDFILFDMGAGASQHVIDLVLAVDEIIVISTTEPTSITDAYSMMKFICLRDPDKRFHIVGNRVSNIVEGNDSVTRLQFAMRKFLDKETSILGLLPEDGSVHKAVLAQKPFLHLFPNAPISKKIKIMASTFVELETSIESKRKPRFLGRLKNMFTKGHG